MHIAGRLTAVALVLVTVTAGCTIETKQDKPPVGAGSNTPEFGTPRAPSATDPSYR